VYTDVYHFQAWKRLSDEQGWAFSEALNDQLRGVSRMASLQIILDHNNLTLSDAEKEAHATQKNEYYKELLKTIDESAVVPGAVSFIRALRERGMVTGLGSSSKNARTVLDALSISDLFDAVITGHEITRSKPDPQIFQLVAEQLEIAPEECVVFEDAVSGVEAAQAGGMVAVGFGPTAGLEIADVRVGAFSDLDVDAFIARGGRV
jgi:beta-phosphoglucomutase